MPTTTDSTALTTTIIATVRGRARLKSGWVMRTAADPNTVPEKSVSTCSARLSGPGRRVKRGNSTRADRSAVKPTTSAKSTLTRSTGARSSRGVVKVMPAATSAPTAPQLSAHSTMKRVGGTVPGRGAGRAGAPARSARIVASTCPGEAVATAEGDVTREAP